MAPGLRYIWAPFRDVMTHAPRLRPPLARPPSSPIPPPCRAGGWSPWPRPAQAPPSPAPPSPAEHARPRPLPRPRPAFPSAGEPRGEGSRGEREGAVRASDFLPARRPLRVRGRGDSLPGRCSGPFRPVSTPGGRCCCPAGRGRAVPVPPGPGPRPPPGPPALPGPARRCPADTPPPPGPPGSPSVAALAPAPRTGDAGLQGLLHLGGRRQEPNKSAAVGSRINTAACRMASAEALVGVKVSKQTRTLWEKVRLAEVGSRKPCLHFPTQCQVRGVCGAAPSCPARPGTREPHS